jgi:hypothetical protein
MNTPNGHAAQVTPPAQPGWCALAGEEPPLGAHLMTPRLGYTHHGIYVGQGEVVHYSGLSRRLMRGPVERVTISQFAAGRALFVATGTGDRFDAQDVVRRACSRLGEDCYRLASNNCEHFCSWCCSGESRSEQVERLAGLLQSALRSLQRLIGTTPPPWHARTAG